MTRCQIWGTKLHCVSKNLTHQMIHYVPNYLKVFLREGIQKKWKFLMTFASKGGGAVSSPIRFLSNIVLLVDRIFWDFLRQVRTGRSCFLSMLTWKPSTPRKLKGWEKPWRRLRDGLPKKSSCSFGFCGGGGDQGRFEQCKKKLFAESFLENRVSFGRP